jgi:hypothetical protein
MWETLTEVETLSLRRALRGTFPCANPASWNTKPWERSLRGLAQNRALPLKSAQAGMELSDRRLCGIQETLGGSPSPLNEKLAGLQWLTAIILATQEAVTRKMEV